MTHRRLLQEQEPYIDNPIGMSLRLIRRLTTAATGFENTTAVRSHNTLTGLYRMLSSRGVMLCLLTSASRDVSVRPTSPGYCLMYLFPPQIVARSMLELADSLELLAVAICQRCPLYSYFLDTGLPNDQGGQRQIESLFFPNRVRCKPCLIFFTEHSLFSRFQ